MYGKSYDAGPGWSATTSSLEAPGAVVAQEPVWSRYNYLFSNGVPRSERRPAAGASTTRSTPRWRRWPTTADRYKANAPTSDHPACLATSRTQQQDNADPARRSGGPATSPRPRSGTRTPLFVTQGFIEDNTKPEDIGGVPRQPSRPERGWLGAVGPRPRQRDVDSGANGQPAMGRAGWFDEVMRFYDRYLKGK